MNDSEPPSCSFCKTHSISTKRLTVQKPEPHEIVYRRFENHTNNDATPIICVPGLTRTVHDFDFIAQSLSYTNTVYSLEMPGRGSSTYFSDASHYTYPTYINDCQSFISFLNFSSVWWLGTSMGGVIGMFLSSLPNSPITKLVLNDIGYFVPYSALQQISQYIKHIGPFPSFEDGVEYLKNVYAQFGNLSYEQWRHFAEGSLKKVDDQYFLHYDTKIVDAFNAAVENGQNIDLSSVWELVEIPVLLLRGKDSSVLLKDVADKMGEKSNCEVVEFDGCGHCPSLMDERHIEIVKNFLFQ
ncbi:hypothetical protein GEMRC1_011491 [Eukaryota sp. GEM-RC1]